MKEEGGEIPEDNHDSILLWKILPQISYHTKYNKSQATLLKGICKYSKLTKVYGQYKIKLISH